jgi:hypothetical protein
MTAEPYGEPHPESAEQLSLFAFLIGHWKGEGQSRDEDGTRSDYQMTWLGRYILDGHAIADEARVYGGDGELSALFITYRYWIRSQSRWIIEAHDVLQSKLVTQAAQDLGGVRVEEDSIAVMTRWPAAIGREWYLDRSENHFTYRLDVSLDGGETWLEGVDRIDAYRL